MTVMDLENFENLQWWAAGTNSPAGGTGWGRLTYCVRPKQPFGQNCEDFTHL